MACAPYTAGKSAIRLVPANSISAYLLFPSAPVSLPSVHLSVDLDIPSSDLQPMERVSLQFFFFCIEDGFPVLENRIHLEEGYYRSENSFLSCWSCLKICRVLFYYFKCAISNIYYGNLSFYRLLLMLLIVQEEGENFY